FLSFSFLVFLCILEVKANLLQFGIMIRATTGKSAFPHYSTYGCYCGIGGKGDPVDATDRCCQVHDCCYGKMSSLGCNPKMEIYSYSIQKGSVICGKTLCKRMICECDAAAAECFQKSTYHLKYAYYPNWLCKGASPDC
uniref:Phospholipase A2 n=1 Tax=Salvator merianae TaxID=96440 RepID=A0A8D0BVN4_SALMN